MEIDPNADGRSMYRTLTGLIVPRPIGWISTTSADGTDNLAPYSFFNGVSIDPPVVMFAPLPRPHGHTDTAANVRETEEFVVNVVTHEFAEAMNETSATVPESESEFDAAELNREPSRAVAPPRVSGIAAALECELYELVPVGDGAAVLGEVVHVHVRDDVTTDGNVDTEKLDVVGRLAGGGYDRVTDRFEMARPD